MNLKNNIKSKQIQTVRHNPDKDSCSCLLSSLIFPLHLLLLYIGIKVSCIDVIKFNH